MTHPNRLTMQGSVNSTCEVLNGDVSKRWSDDDSLCRPIQATFGEYCDCEIPVELESDTCRLCGGDTPIPAKNHDLRVFWAGFGFGESCLYFEMQMQNEAPLNSDGSKKCDWIANEIPMYEIFRQRCCDDA